MWRRINGNRFLNYASMIGIFLFGVLSVVLVNNFKEKDMPKNGIAVDQWNIYEGKVKFENESILITKPKKLFQTNNITRHYDPFYWKDEIIYEACQFSEINENLWECDIRNSSGEVVYLNPNCKISFPYPLSDKQLILEEKECGKGVFITNVIDKTKVKLIDKSLFDNVIIKKNNINFLFGYDSSEKCLRVYYNNNLFGKPYIEHPRSCKYKSLENSRLAGSPQYFNKILYFPMMDNRKFYGGGVQYFKVKNLTKNNFELASKPLVVNIENIPEMLSIHHVDINNGKAVFDVKSVSRIANGFKTFKTYKQSKTNNNNNNKINSFFEKILLFLKY